MPSFSDSDLLFMRRALDLARLGAGRVSPNPLVGCVVVQAGQIIGEGWHQVYGGWHAEVNAIDAVLARYGEDDAAPLLAEATAYVTLEPCAHWGKTPPCADLLIRHRLRRVVVCNADPNPLVAGQGLRRMREAGIQVETGLLEPEGRWLNRRFFCFFEKKRPYLVLKWAESADGFVARPNREPVQISNPLAQQLVHKWRGEEAGILVGACTALSDNPRLDTRHWPGQNPTRIVLAPQTTLPSTLHLFDGSQPTLIYNLLENNELPNRSRIRVEAGSDFLPQVLADLHRRRIGSVLVEGGPATLGAFLKNELWDEIRLLRSPHSLGAGLEAPRPAGRLLHRDDLLGDELHTFVRE